MSDQEKATLAAPAVDAGGQPPPDQQLEIIVEKMSLEHGFDVRGYKRSTLYRRIRKRMTDAGAACVDDYVVRLESDRHEYTQLLNTILINVTEFFRDPQAWEYLQASLEKLQEQANGGGIRVWSVGCATGEEPYSLAIALAEVFGDRSLRDVKIYATDVDESALATARAGVYSADDLRNVSPERLRRYFDELPGGRFSIRRDLRSMVVYGRHNVMTDPPISRLDLLVCRNVLIYFDADTQMHILGKFHYALRHEGYLFLGKAETMMTRSSLFRPVDPRYRIFQRVPQRGGVEVLLSNLEQRKNPWHSLERSPDVGLAKLLQRVINEASEPVIVLDGQGRILMSSQPARDAFLINDALVGRSFLELGEAYRPVSLRLAIEEVRTTGRPARVEKLELVRPDGSCIVLRVDARPVLDRRANLVQIILWCRDLTREWEMDKKLGQVHHDMETLSEELQTTNEELETTNEELQSTNEELETANEELQSTNEELETTIEELQSTNEELETANEELRARQEQLNSVTHYQEMVLSSLNMGLIVLNAQGKITGWNKMCEELWGLREAEVAGQELWSLDIGLPVTVLRAPFTDVTERHGVSRTVEVDGTNRRGRPLHCSLQIHSVNDGDAAPAGAVLMIRPRD